MAITDSFDLFTDTGQTTAFTGTLSFVHFTDLSDNGQDGVLYLGSNTVGRKIEANSNPAVDNMTITPTDGIADWVTATAYSLGDRVEPTTPNTFVYEVTTAGTSDGSEPTWPTTGIGSSTVVDGTVTWTLISARHELTEVKLALTNGGLTAATAGAALSLGTSITSEVANQVEIHYRITNAVTNVADNTGNSAITLNLNTLLETKV
jgi:hypothetical protein